MWLLELLQFLLRSRDSFRISKSAIAKLFPRAIMVSSKISSARSSASSSEGKTFSSPTVRRIPTRWNVLWTGFRTAANSTRQPFRLALNQFFQCVDTCHVDGGHVVQIHYEYLGRRLHRVQRGLESVSHTEEQRPVDGENFHSVGHVVFVRDRDFVPGCLVLPGNAGMPPF